MRSTAQLQHCDAAMAKIDSHELGGATG